MNCFCIQPLLYLGRTPKRKRREKFDVSIGNQSYFKFNNPEEFGSSKEYKNKI